MKAEDIRLSYTNPITGDRSPRDLGLQYVELDGVLLVVKHFYRSRYLGRDFGVRHVRQVAPQPRA